MANILGGLMTFGIHPLSNKIPESEYSVFIVLLMVTAALPTMPLQMVFAQQTARALAQNRERQLAGMIRLAWLWLFVLWLASALVILIFQTAIVERWKLGSALPLWITLVTVLLSLWAPMVAGVLQGRQDFFSIGWSAILGGVCRVGVAATLVLAVGAGAAGMMAGALAGMAVATGIALWQTRDLWSLPRERFDGKSLVRQIMPLVLGFGVCQFMFTADTMFAKAFFTGQEMAPYGAAGTLSRSLMWLVLPLAAVMFPKIVHSSAKSEKSNLLGLVLLGTAVLSICGGLGLSLIGPWLVERAGIFPATYVKPMAVLLPWYALAMVPLALANVLINDLMARGRFRVVPAMVLLVVVYGFTVPYILNHFPKKLETVLQTLGVFNFLLLIICAVAAFAGSKPTVQSPQSGAPASGPAQ